MLIRIAAVIALVGAVYLGWRVYVRQSRLLIRSEGLHFPTVSGFNLNRHEFELPRDFEGDLNLLFVAFRQRHQPTVDTWLRFAEELESSVSGLVYYELPTIDEMSGVSRTFINEGMRAGIPNPKARERTITLYIDTKQFMQATEIPNKDDVHMLLVNRKGEILWRTTGDFSPEKGKEMRRFIDGGNWGQRA